MALHHEIMAKMIEGRLAGRPTYYWNAPSLIPVDPARKTRLDTLCTRAENLSGREQNPNLIDWMNWTPQGGAQRPRPY